ncbi:hypothetical protein [Pseudomonas sp. MUP55]|uniref:hypothetical protein n=1 Tax=Pseudomonas sp. MUP55 TaxID=3087234 RepID=UPI002A5AA780|nr:MULTISPECIES: hypothetical protein [unclassified Pseudomonas]WPN90935.1 hypothetical protein SC319_16910 [Pseudomonas sp. MUP56]WPN96460.1 hypothetical protein SC318_16915 [Pseudomonas sp. MUP55]
MKRSDSRSFWCITAVLIVVVGLLGYQIVDGLIRGVIVAFSRVGPSTTYTLLEQPKQYWMTLGWLAIVEAFLIAMTLGVAWISSAISKNEKVKGG